MWKLRTVAVALGEEEDEPGEGDGEEEGPAENIPGGQIQWLVQPLADAVEKYGRREVAARLGERGRGVSI
jgi:hypothetical protein